MAGERMGPYLIDRELGSGGMGTVYEGRAADGTRVALKVVHPHLLEKDGYRERFLRELAVGRRIEHPNVVRTLDGGEIDGRPYLALEFVEGQTLGDLRRELGRVPEDLCRHIGYEVSRGLEAIHAERIVHRDLTPGNVLITPEQVVKVMDLGLAREATGDDRLSMTGMFVGTLGYAPPEQFHGARELDPRGDLYSLGALLYELATGEPVFKPDSIQVMVRVVLNEEPRRPGQLNPQLSPFFEELLLALLAKRPEERVSSAALLAEVLARGEATDWWSDRMTELREETRRPLRRIRIPRETECVGRDEELAALRAAFDGAKAGDGRVVLIEGEAGIGKSRLIDELMRRLERDGEDVNFLYGSYPPGGAATAAGAFSAAYGTQLGSSGSARYLTEAPLLAPGLDALLRGDLVAEGASPLTSDSLKTALVHVTRALGNERPTVVVIDDLHFAPDEGRALFASLAMAVPGHPILLVGTARPGLPKEWTANITRLEQVARTHVRRLGDEDVSRLLEPVLGRSLQSEKLASSIAATADGNPFFLFEIVRSLRESGVLERADDGSWAPASRVTVFEIPETVQSLLDARIERLSDEEREMLDCAACLGFTFDGRLIALALGMRSLPALRLLGHLEQTHGLVRAAGARFSFDHHAIQEHLYARLPEAIREELHAAVAEALDARADAAEKDPETLDGALCVDLCEHFLKGARGESASRYLRAAQAHLAEGYLYEEVVALTEGALASPDLLTGVDRAKSLLRLAAALDRMGRRARQEECVLEAVRLAEESGDDECRGRTASALAGVLQTTSRMEEAEAACRRALEITRARGDGSFEARITVQLGHILREQGRRPEAREQFERSLAISLEIGDRTCEANAIACLGIVHHSEGRLAEAREHFGRALALTREIGDLGGETSATGNLGLVALTEFRLGEARELIERHLALSRETGNRNKQYTATGNLSLVFKFEGRLDAARELDERNLALAREIGDPAKVAGALENLGHACAAQGRLPEAREHLTSYLTLGREIGDRKSSEANALSILARVLNEQGESDRARECLAECLALSEEIDDPHLAARSHRLLGSVRATAGDEEGKRESLVEARDVAQKNGIACCETLARCELALLPGGDPEGAVAAFTANEDRISDGECIEARHLLWLATADDAHLKEAKRLLDESVAKVGDETRRSMLASFRVNREVVAAYRAEFGDDDPGGSGAAPPAD